MCGFYAGQVDLTRDISHGREQMLYVDGACFSQSAAAAASKTTVLAFLRLVTFFTVMTVLIILLRLQPARDSRHTVGLGIGS